MPDSVTHASLNKEKHIRYWLRCLKTHLPNPYTSNEAQRMSLAFFILFALDLLDALHSRTSASERSDYANWILRCQHPDGGFRGFTGTMTGNENSNEWDAANLAATYFACAALAVLGEGLERVRRKECLEWVRRLQRPNGSFGEGIGKGGVVEGAEDMRFCYLAAVTRWFLRRGEGTDEVEDIDVEALARWIEASVVSRKNNNGMLCHRLHTNLYRPTKEALHRAHSTRHMVRSMLLLLPGEEAILIRVCSWVYVLWRRCTQATGQAPTAYDRCHKSGGRERGVCGERDQMARVAADTDAARRRRTPHDGR